MIRSQLRLESPMMSYSERAFNDQLSSRIFLALSRPWNTPFSVSLVSSGVCPPSTVFHVAVHFTRVPSPSFSQRSVALYSAIGKGGVLSALDFSYEKWDEISKYRWKLEVKVAVPETIGITMFPSGSEVLENIDPIRSQFQMPPAANLNSKFEPEN